MTVHLPQRLTVLTIKKIFNKLFVVAMDKCPGNRLSNLKLFDHLMSTGYRSSKSYTDQLHHLFKKQKDSYAVAVAYKSIPLPSFIYNLNNTNFSFY